MSLLLTTTLAYAVAAHRHNHHHHHPNHQPLHNNHNRHSNRIPSTPSIAFLHSNPQRSSHSSPTPLPFSHHHHYYPPTTTKSLLQLYSSPPQDPETTAGKKKRVKSRSEEDDDKEWETLVSAFRMYKAAYGDLKVPVRFVVPAMHPWPEPAWGLKLGQRVATIRSTQRFVSSSPSRRATLDSLGFLWRLRTPKKSPSPSSSSPSPSPNDVPFEQIYRALQGYRTNIQTTGPLSVPLGFTVPTQGGGGGWDEDLLGLELGNVMSIVRSDDYLTANPGAREKLDELGFQFDGKAAANEARFHRVYRTLVRYKELYGDLSIAQSFVVPEGEEGGEWSEEMRGLKLGARVNAIRNQGTFVKNNPGRRAMLDELGFEFELKKDRRKKKVVKKEEEKEEEEELIPEAEIETPPTPPPPPPLPEPAEFQITKDPPSFDIDDFLRIESPELDPITTEPPPPTNNEPPPPPPETTRKRTSTKPTWAFEDTNDEQMALLQQRQQQAALDAELEEYRPPRTLDVTLNQAAELAMRVGVIQSYGEEKRVSKGKIDKRFPWFNDDFGDDFVYEDVVDALKIYYEIHQSWEGLHYDTESEQEDFVVPPPPHLDETNPDPFGEGSGGLTPQSKKISDDFDLTGDLAMTLDSLDSLDGPTEADLFGDGGIDDDDIFGDGRAEREIRELETLSLRHPWPEALSGMRLGHITRRIRDGSLEVGHIPERRAKLDEIGFDWGPPARFLDVPFEKAMCAMFAYYLIRGDLFVTSDFVIPDDEPWPEVYAGYELGKVVERIRELQHFFEAYHTEKVRLLRRVEFVWFPELALPLDPNKGEDSWEDMVVEGIGHPFFWMNDPDVEMIEGLQADGPSYGRRPKGDEESDEDEGDEDDARNKDWYEYNTVRDYWEEKRGVTASTKRATGRDYPWKPAQWLLMNGFNQLSAEHEARYGKDNSLELLRTIEEFTKGIEVDDDDDGENIDLLDEDSDVDNISEDDVEDDDGSMTLDEFNDRVADIFQAMQDDRLRKEAREAGYEFGDDWEAADIIQMIKDDVDEDDLLDDGEDEEFEESSELTADGEGEEVEEEYFDEDEFADFEDEDIDNENEEEEEEDANGDDDLEEDNTLGGMQFGEDDFGIEEENV